LYSFTVILQYDILLKMHVLLDLSYVHDNFNRLLKRHCIWVQWNVKEAVVMVDCMWTT